MVSTEVAELVKEIFTIQELRALAYNRLTEGRKTLGNTGGIAYQNFIAATTLELQDLSARVRHVEACLRKVQEYGLANLIDELQSSEKTKLELTATIETIKFAQSQHEQDMQREQGGHCGPDTSFQKMARGAELLAVRDESYKALEECIASIHETMGELQDSLI